MPRVANYMVLGDDDFVLDAENPQQDLSFSLPSGAQLTGTVLAFMINTLEPKFGFEILVNGDTEFTANVDGDAFHSLHEVIGGLRSGPNDIVFRRLEGNLEISGVVLWFQEDV